MRQQTRVFPCCFLSRVLAVVTFTAFLSRVLPVVNFTAFFNACFARSNIYRFFIACFARGEIYRFFARNNVKASQIHTPSTYRPEEK